MVFAAALVAASLGVAPRAGLPPTSWAPTLPAAGLRDAISGAVSCAAVFVVAAPARVAGVLPGALVAVALPGAVFFATGTAGATLVETARFATAFLVVGWLEGALFGDMLFDAVLFGGMLFEAAFFAAGLFDAAPLGIVLLESAVFRAASREALFNVVVFEAVFFDAVFFEVALFDAAFLDTPLFDAVLFDAVFFDAMLVEAARFDAAFFDAMFFDAALFDAAFFDAALFKAAFLEIAVFFEAAFVVAFPAATRFPADAFFATGFRLATVACRAATVPVLVAGVFRPGFVGVAIVRAAVVLASFLAAFFAEGLPDAFPVAGLRAVWGRGLVVAMRVSRRIRSRRRQRPAFDNTAGIQAR